MDRRRFLVIAAAASAAGSAGTAPRAVFARTPHVTHVSVIRWPREMLYGVPGRCAGMRSGANFDLERMLSTR
jgi:anaerobic selenocysteine-containing dehydrogenase